MCKTVFEVEDRGKYSREYSEVGRSEPDKYRQSEPGETTLELFEKFQLFGSIK